MPNLVGIGNSQVPTNAMLGGLAYQDPAHANLTEVEIENIAAIKAKTADTAVDVFVYDTRKDSDGGAWRYRTQHTSWYNEGEGQYRGARKEFPAVAVIVASTSGLTIYDADDPNCSMWMVIVKDNDNWLKHTASGPNSVVALNGNVVSCGGGNPGRLSVINFVSDDGYVTEPGYTYRHSWIATRNSTGVGGSDANDTVNPRHIVNSTCNGVAITVLPNAPIDSGTGLPIPTIAVATDGGVSVIKDDGTVVDLKRTSDDDVHHVAFDDDRVLMYMELGAIYVATIPSADQSGNPNGAWSVYGSFSANTSGTNHPTILAYGAGAGLVSMKDHTFAAAGYNESYDEYKGLSILAQDVSSSGNGMAAWIKKDFNTGWMHGDCKGVWLADTDDTNITGGNLVSNGFDWAGASGTQSSTAPNNWTGGNGATFKTDGATYIRLYNENDGGAGPNSFMTQSFTTVVGKTYKYSVTQMHHATITVYVRIGTSSNGTEVSGGQSWVSSSSESTKYVHGTFTATATTTYISLGIVSGTHNYSVGWDEVIVSLLDVDRTTHKNPLHVFATITKTAVATGAELVSYSGYTYNNYLSAYGATAPGTGDFSVIAWIKPGTNGSGTGNYLHLFNLSTPTTGGQSRGAGFVLKMATNGSGGYSPYFYNADGSNNKGTYDTNNRIPLGAWSQLIGMRRGGKAYIYLNGELMIAGNTWSTNLTDTYLSIFRAPGFSTEVGGDAKVALVRYSTTAPTDEQIKKMYNDEKKLFAENAKCTLYGSSNEVTAVAYDDSNDTLHVGTSGGRSEFVGLNRINNTTTAVTTAISASNGLVAEQ